MSDPAVFGKKIALIAAMAENRVIGKNNRLPWHMPADFDHFRSITGRKPFIMGLNSYQSEDALFSGYKSVILSHRKDLILKENCFLAGSLPEAFDLLKVEPEIFVLGGGQVFHQAEPLANYIYLTLIHGIVEGDCYFPEISEKCWQEVSGIFRVKDAGNPLDCTFLEYRRTNPDEDQSWNFS